MIKVTKENVKAIVEEIRSDCGLMEKIKDCISWEWDEETRIELYCEYAKLCGWIYEDFDEFWKKEVINRAKKNNQDPEDYFYENCNGHFDDIDDLRHNDDPYKYLFWFEQGEFYVYDADYEGCWPEDMYLDAEDFLDLALESENPEYILGYIEGIIEPMFSINSDPILTWNGPDFSSEDLYLTDDEEYVIAINERYGTTESFTTSYEYPSDRELRLWILEHFASKEYNKIFETNLDYLYWNKIDSQCNVNSEVLYFIGAGKYIYKKYSTNVWYGKYAEYVTKEFAEEWITEHFDEETDEEIREEYLAKLK